MKLIMCVLILVLSGALGIDYYKKTKRKYDIFCDISRFFYSISYYVSFEHISFQKSILKYCGEHKENGELSDVIKIICAEIAKDRKKTAAKVLKKVMDKEEGFFELDKQQKEQILYFFSICEEKDRAFLSDILKSAKTWADEQKEIAKTKDMKKGTLIKKMSILIGIAVVILLV